MSIPAPNPIWRIIEALDRPIDQPIGPIQLDTADADWLRDYLLEIATQPAPRKGKPPNNNHHIPVALDVALRLAASENSLKVACGSVAKDWKATDKQVERWELAVRSEAESILKKVARPAIERLVKHNREQYLIGVKTKVPR